MEGLFIHVVGQRDPFPPFGPETASHVTGEGAHNSAEDLYGEVVHLTMPARHKVLGRLRVLEPACDEQQHGPSYYASPSKWDSPTSAGSPGPAPPARIPDPQGSRAPDRRRNRGSWRATPRCWPSSMARACAFSRHAA